MARCQKCGKNRSVGRKSRHRRGVASKKFANKATKKSRLFKPNLQKISFMAGGLALTMLLCTRCIKKMKQGKRSEKVKVKSKEPRHRAKKLARESGGRKTKSQAKGQKVGKKTSKKTESKKKPAKKTIKKTAPKKSR